MIQGLGVDIVEIDRMKAALERHPRIKERLFSEEERRYCDERNRPEIHYALRFAAKEAVLKALGTGFSGTRFTDVTVARDERGRPFPRLEGRAAEVAEERGVDEFHLSLSYTHQTAVASAVAIVNEGRPTEEGLDESPQARLVSDFKEAKGLLDELDEQGESDDMDEQDEASDETSG